MPLAPTSRLGPYEIVRLLGVGGMSEVYSARDARLGRLVALKVLHDRLSGDPGHLRRLRREAMAAGSLNHPNVVAIHDLGSDGDATFIVSELVEGETLRERLATGRLAAARALDYASQAASGLAAAHDKGIVHRDLKPENLMLTPDGRVKILDFGVAKIDAPLARLDDDGLEPTSPAITLPGVVLGTVAYMSPEQLRGDQLDGRSDIFSLGVILFEMLTGERPFRGPTAAEVMAAVLRDAPAVPSGLPAGVRAIVERCLAKDPSDRFATAHDLAGALASVPDDPGAAAPSIAATDGRPAATVAVLPFTNASAAPDDAYFSDGLTEQLIHELTRARRLRVLAWHSASRLRGREEDTRRDARDLGADHLLVGSVRRAGDRVRISARLVETATGLYLWSESYDRELLDLFAIQESIARAIARTLEGTLSTRQRPTLSAARLQAYDLYLRGRYLWNQRTADGLEQSVACFTQALAIDEAFALAHSGLADAYCLLAEYGIRPPEETMPLARVAALRALEIEPRSSEAHASHAMIRGMHDWEWSEAEALYRRAIELNPGYATAHHWLALDLLALLGRLPEAHDEIELARQFDPLSLAIMEGKPYLLMLERRYDEALEGYRRIVELDGGFARAYTGMGRTLLQAGRFGEGIGMLEKGRELAGDTSGILGALGQGLAWSGNVDGARAILAKLVAMCEARYVPCTTFALVHSALAERGTAIDWLERAADRHDLPVAMINVHPAYDALRPEPRFASLLERLRFPAV
jgi:eukaryotic-like serine/threonine-protein kinase